MLTLKIPLGPEDWDEEKEQFVVPEYKSLQLEHSLVSLQKWESKWHKPFLSQEEKTYEETLDYIRCMTITQNVKPEVYKMLTEANIKEVNSYIEDPMTATTFSDNKRKGNKREIITAEIIYYWMVSFNIPPEYRKWPLNSLLTLIRVCEAKASPKKQSKAETTSQYAAINAARRKKLNSKG